MKNQRNQQPIVKSDIHEGAINGHIELISKEFRQGFDFVKKYPKSVSIFGSSTLRSDSQYYQDAEKMASRIAREIGYAVVTGGGPGIMEAANKGAMSSGGASLGLRISIPSEHFHSEFLTDSMKFAYFFSRKAMLMFAAEAYIFLPGGFGTMDELFEVLTLIQTGKIPKVPVILFGDGYWTDLIQFMKNNMIDKNHTIDQKDLDLFEVTDSVDRVIEIIRSAPVSEWWRNLN